METLNVCFKQTENILNISGVLTLVWKPLKFWRMFDGGSLLGLEPGMHLIFYSNYVQQDLLDISFFEAQF